MRVGYDLVEQASNSMYQKKFEQMYKGVMMIMLLMIGAPRVADED
jgi:hypothetical protein